MKIIYLNNPCNSTNQNGTFDFFFGVAVLHFHRKIHGNYQVQKLPFLENHRVIQVKS